MMDYDAPSNMKFVMKVDNRKGITSRCASCSFIVVIAVCPLVILTLFDQHHRRVDRHTQPCHRSRQGAPQLSPLPHLCTSHLHPVIRIHNSQR
jgi:hypothetical protein